LAPEATLTQITNELKSAFDWLNAKVHVHHQDRLARVATAPSSAHATAISRGSHIGDAWARREWSYCRA
jgi:hypothetical protein